MWKISPDFSCALQDKILLSPRLADQATRPNRYLSMTGTIALAKEKRPWHLLRLSQRRLLRSIGAPPHPWVNRTERCCKRRHALRSCWRNPDIVGRSTIEKYPFAAHLYIVIGFYRPIHSCNACLRDLEQSCNQGIDARRHRRCRFSCICRNESP